MKKLLVFAFVVSAFAVSAFAAPPHVYIGFTGIQTENTADAAIKYVDVQVGSDEPDNSAQDMNIVVSLTAVDQDGKTVCSKLKEYSVKLRPAKRPLRFQISYPKIRKGPQIGPVTRNYRLFAKVVWRLLETPNVGGTVQNSITYAFRVGGAPACRAVMAGGYPPGE